MFVDDWRWLDPAGGYEAEGDGVTGEGEKQTLSLTSAAGQEEN